MAIIKKYSPYQNLSSFQTFLIDDNPNSDYFRITEFKDTFTGGKNGFLIEGSEFLKETTEVKVEILDVEGNPVYFEPGDGNPEYYEGLSKLVSVHVYDDTPIGIGKITILGELKNYINESGASVPVPDEWKGIYNVKWEKSFKINKNLNNEDVVRFYKRPIVNITEIVKPIFNKTIPTKTISGSVSGIPQQPTEGSDLSTWSAGTLYKLVKSSGSWDVDIDENPITVSVDGNTYTPNIIEVLNEREVLVDVPYTSNNIVQSFTSQSFTASYQDIENEVVGDSSLTGSFAKIDMYQLKTFVGDVARVKVFRKSRNEVGDFQLVQESKLESSELLRDVYTTSSVEIPYGQFSTDVLTNYWETSSNDHSTSVNSAVLNQAVKVDYDNGIGGVQTLSTQESFTLSKDVEYTLSFRTLLSGSSDSEKYVKAYFSGSYTNSLGNPTSYTQSFMHVSGSDIYKTRQSVSQNILAERDIDAKLVFEFKGDDWYVSNVSLRNAQETSFSPDEFTLIQDIPRKLETETFDFRFEFYDINNNYIPVDVKSTKEFDGGNDYTIGGTSAKILIFESDRNAFRFESGSIGSPYNQTVQFQITKTNLTGSTLFESRAFDTDGNYLDPSDYSQYPGLLTNVTPSSALLTLSNFTGSYSGGGTRPYVGSIVYTASCEDLVEYETTFRVEDGDNAPQLLVTSNANQFIYEPTTLSPKPSGQSITIRAQRKNLDGLNSTITVTSGSNLPELTTVSDTGGIKTYSISATEFSSSFAQNDFDEVTYNFSSNDIFGNPQTDQITLSKVINFDGVSIVLSNESVTFPAYSSGTVYGGFGDSSGSVQMFIGGTQIQHDDIGGGRLKNTFDITSISGTNVTPTSTSPTNQYYSISGMSEDSGSLILDIEYLAGDGSTSQSFQKIVSYNRSRKSAPNIEFQIEPTSQTIDANSKGNGSATPQSLTVTAREGDSSKSVSITTPPTSITNGLSGTISSNTFTFTSNATSMSADTGLVTLAVSAVNSEGTTVTGSVTSTVSIARAAVPNVEVAVTPSAQTIDANSLGSGSVSPQTLTITALEGTADRFTSIDSVTFSGGLSGNISSNTITFTDTASEMESDTETATIVVNYTDSEGTVGQKTVKSVITRTRKAVPTVLTKASPASQTINSSSALFEDPQDITVFVMEGGDEYTYQSSLTGGISNANKFEITAVESGSNVDEVITPTKYVGGTNGNATIQYVNSEGTLVTNKIIRFDVGVSKIGQDGLPGDPGPSGSNAFSIELNPPSQEVILDVTGSITTPDTFVVQVFDGQGSYSYSSTLATNGTFKITNLAQTNHSGTPSNSSGTITSVVPDDANGSDVTFDVTVKDRGGNTSSAISKTHKIRVVAEGSTGPGIVFTGPWDTDRIYQYDISNGRRDSVLYNGTYYATLQQAGTSVGTPDTELTYWESLGTDDFFVAAKIAIFEDSYVQKVLNIGTNSSSSLSAANITLNGTDNYPYFSLGQSPYAGTQEYGANGIFIGRHDATKNSDAGNGAYVLSISNGINWMKWNGSSLDIKGDITATSITLESGVTIPNTSVDGLGNLSTQDLADLGDLAALDSVDHTRIDSGSITTPLIYAGAVTTAKIATNAIKSGGFASGSNLPFSDNGSFLNLANGDFVTPYFAVNSSGGYFAGTLQAGTIMSDGDIQGGTISGSAFVGATGDFSGEITASAGEIGGWGITTNEMYSPSSGNRVMELTAGSSPAIAIYSSSAVVVDINSQTSLTDLGAGGGVSGTSSTTNYGSDNSSVNFNNFASINFNPNVSDGVYYDDNSYQTITIDPGDEGTYTVSANLTDASIGRLAYLSISGGSTGTEVGSFSGGIYMGFWITTNNLNPYNFIFESQYSQQTFYKTITLSGASWSSNLTNNVTATVSKTVNFTSSGTYYVYPVCWKFYGSINMPYSGYGYTASYTMYSPKYTGLSASINIFKSELNAGGIQVVSSNTNYVKMQRQPGISSTTTVMLDVGGSIEATGNITANASDERLKIVKSNIENPLTKIKNLNGIIFNWNQLAKELGGYDTEIENVGLIAQEVQKVLPQAVTKAPIDNGNGENYLTIWYDKIVALLIEGMKELNDKVEKLEEENKRLNNGNS